MGCGVGAGRLRHARLAEGQLRLACPGQHSHARLPGRATPARRQLSAMEAPSSFTVVATGQIESALAHLVTLREMDVPVSPTQMPDVDNAYLKFQMVAGEDWQVLDGLEEGITQASKATPRKKLNPTVHAKQTATHAERASAAANQPQA
eukprot:363670-Chlamydomonas_euryale.AAC.6